MNSFIYARSLAVYNFVIHIYVKTAVLLLTISAYLNGWGFFIV